MSINEIVRNLVTMEKLTEDITKECRLIFPLQNVTIRKVKVLKRPKIDAVKLNEMYSHEKQVNYNKGGANDEDDSAQNTLSKTAKRERRPR
jgi:small subunit ribosomal protein S3Ae